MKSRTHAHTEKRTKPALVCKNGEHTAKDRKDTIRPNRYYSTRVAMSTRLPEHAVHTGKTAIATSTH